MCATNTSGTLFSQTGRPCGYNDFSSNKRTQMRLAFPLVGIAICLYIGGNLLSAGVQIVKAQADRTAAAICYQTGDCN
jgi:hypothetical protein